MVKAIHEARLLRIDVYKAWFYLTVFIFNIFQVQRMNVSFFVCCYHTASRSFVKQFFNAHSQKGTIQKIVGHWLNAAHFVTNFHRTAFHFNSQTFQFALNQKVENVRLAYVAQFRMAMFVVSKIYSCRFDFGIRHKMEHTFADDDPTVGYAQQFPFQHG